jgi:hypothetical protein
VNFADVSERVLFLHRQGRHVLLRGDLRRLDVGLRQKVTVLDEGNLWTILDRWARLDDDVEGAWLLHDPTGLLDEAIKDKIITLDLDRL